MRSIFANVSDLRAFATSTIPPSQEAYCLVNGTAAIGTSGACQRMIWLPTSTSPDNNQGQLVVIPTAGGTGRWIRRDPLIDLILPVTFASADGLQLCLVPAELTLLPCIAAPFLEVTTIWAGGVASTIGLSMSTPSLGRTKGNLGGAAVGDSGMTSTFFKQFTLGSQFAPGLTQAPVLSPTSQIFWDRITSAFTSGAGNVHIPCHNFATMITPVAPP